MTPARQRDEQRNQCQQGRDQHDIVKLEPELQGRDAAVQLQIDLAQLPAGIGDLAPRREHDPCFEGYIYIQDDSWRLVGLDLLITKKANISIADSIRINQQFVPVSSKAWMTSTIRFDFTGGLFGFNSTAYKK